jgi:hypothetical protein
MGVSVAVKPISFRRAQRAVRMDLEVLTESRVAQQTRRRRRRRTGRRLKR